MTSFFDKNCKKHMNVKMLQHWFVLLLVFFFVACRAKSSAESPVAGEDPPVGAGLFIENDVFFSGGHATSEQFSLKGYITPYSSAFETSDAHLFFDVTVAEDFFGEEL